MRRQHVRSFIFAVLSVAVSSFLPVAETGISGRSLQQSSLSAGDVIVSNISELEDALGNLQANQTIVIDNPDIGRLGRTMIMDIPGVTIRGKRGIKPTIRCPARKSRNAMLIRAVDLQLESLSFQGCSQASAILIETAEKRRGEEAFSVTLRDVTFMDNGHSDNLVNGSAISVNKCTMAECLEPKLRIESCIFKGNRGEFGGAVYVRDSTLTITDCEYVNNTAAGQGGAVYAWSPGRALNIRNTTFLRNGIVLERNSVAGITERDRTRRGAGAVFAYNHKTLRVNQSRFIENFSLAGGGGLFIYMIDGQLRGFGTIIITVDQSHFELNSVLENRTLQLADTYIINRRKFMGGGILVDTSEDMDIDILISNSVIRKNSAHQGGGLYLSAVPKRISNIVNCTFEGNNATGGGGIQLVVGALYIRSSLIKGNHALWGGGINVDPGADMKIISDTESGKDVTIIEDNAAMFAAGIYYAGSGASVLEYTIIRNNVAFLHGGGMEIHAVSDSIHLKAITLENNRALIGGGIAAITMNNLVMMSRYNKRCLVRGNKALVGGGIYAQLGADLPIGLRILDTDFELNEAIIATNETFAELLGLEKFTGQYQPTHFVPAISADSYLGVVSAAGHLFDLLTTLPLGEGGGVAIDLRSVLLASYVDFGFSNVAFNNNSAVVGGGASVHFTDLLWSNGAYKTCFPSEFAVEPCQRFYFTGVEMHGNKAEYGGGIFTTHPNYILAACHPTQLNTDESVQSVVRRQMKKNATPVSAEESRCLSISGNALHDGIKGKGADVGTLVKKIVLEGRDEQDALKTVASGDKLTFDCPASGKTNCDPRLVVVAKDAFGQTISRGTKDANLELFIVSEDVTGATHYRAESGKAVIEETRVRGVGISSNITIRTDQYPIEIFMNFSTRSCYPGEQERGELCLVCPSESYSLNTTLRSCRSCESNAICAGGASLVPLDGYWHSNPFSPQMHRCIFREACDFKRRSEELREFYADPQRLQSGIAEMQAYLENRSPKPAFNDYDQCATGFGGPLCGSCADGYGHSRSGICEECPLERSTTRFFLTLTIFWMFVLVGANCLLTLSSANDRISLVEYETNSEVERNRVRKLRRCAGHVQDGPSIRSLPSSEKSVAETSQNGGLPDQSLSMLKLMATVQIAETLKILLNYLQVTSAAFRLQIDWMSAMSGLLGFQGAVVGLTSDAVTVPFECNFGDDYDLPASVIAIFMRMGTPFIVLLGIIIVYSISWFAKRSKEKDGSDDDSAPMHLLSGIIIIVIVAFYFSYIETVREFVRSVNCVPVDWKSDDTVHPYQIFAYENEHRVWADDTDLVCFHGDHRLVGLLGCFGLFVALLAILFIIVWLPINRSRRMNKDFIVRYWFIYQAYRAEWYTLPWEAAVLTRKALIATVLVFSFQLGADLQALLCVGVLFGALGLHVSFHPYKAPEHHYYVPDYAVDIFRSMNRPQLAKKWLEINNSIELNALETTSLLMSGLVFFSATIVNHPNATDSSITLLIAFVFTSNLLFFVYMLYRLYSGFHVVLDLNLELKNPDFMATHKNSFSILHFFRKLATLLVTLIKGYMNESKSDENLDAVVV